MGIGYGRRKDTHESRLGARGRAGGRGTSGRAARGSEGAGVPGPARTRPGVRASGTAPRGLPSIHDLKPPGPVHTSRSPPTLPQVPAPRDVIVPEWPWPQPLKVIQVQSSVSLWSIPEARMPFSPSNRTSAALVQTSSPLGGPFPGTSPSWEVFFFF